MCDGDRLIKTSKYEETIFTVFNKSLTHDEAENQCQCMKGSNILAVLNSKATFKYVSDELMKLKSETGIPYWRIGLRRDEDTKALTWADGEVLRNRPKYMLTNNDGNCFKMLISRASGFLKPLKCEQSYPGELGYICSSVYDTFTQDSFEDNVTEYERTAKHHVTLVSTSFPQLTTHHGVDEIATGPSLLTILLPILGCVIILFLVVLLIKKRQKLKKRKRTGTAKQQNTLPGEQISIDIGAGGYASISISQQTQHITTSNLQFEQGQGSTHPVQHEDDQTTPKIEDAYAVVNKKKASKNNPAMSDQTYAVVNKKKSGNNNAGTSDQTYAVVNKRKLKDAASTSLQTTEITYAVVNKKKSDDNNVGMCTSQPTVESTYAVVNKNKI